MIHTHTYLYTVCVCVLSGCNSSPDGGRFSLSTLLLLSPNSYASAAPAAAYSIDINTLAHHKVTTTIYSRRLGVCVLPLAVCDPAA
jgi:hypothetical protein